MLVDSPDQAGRLRRSKSASTVNPGQRPRIPDHVDPWVAQQQALLAATTAYERAHAGVSPTRLTNVSQAIPRTKSTTSRRSEGSHLAKRSSTLRYSMDEHPRHQLPRRNTIQVSGSKNNPTSSTAAKQVPLSIASASGPNLRTKVSLSTLATPPRSISSEPVRAGLRKARSMFYSSSRTTTGNNEDTASLTLIDVTQNTDLTEKLTALPPYPVQTSQSIQAEAIKLAREQWSQQENHKVIRRQRSSTLFTPFKRLQGISSRKSSYTEPAGGTLPSVRSTAVTPAPSLGTSITNTIRHKKSRSFSGGLKDKLMKVFRRTPSDPPIDMPAQQVDAARTYYYTSNPTTDEISNDIADDRSSRSGLHPSRPPTPPFPRESSYIHQPKKRQGSSASDESTTSNSKSRVTSWTDSSTGNTAGAKRLSIIHEVSRPNIAMPVPMRPPSSLITKNMLDKALGIEDATPGPPFHFPVEPKRVYSALMKEMARKDMEVVEIARLDIDENGLHVPSDLDMLPSQAKRTSTESGRNDANKVTIRTVSPEDMRALSRASSVRGQVRIPPLDLPDVEEESSGDEFPTERADGCSLYAQSESHRESSSLGRLQRSQKAHPPTAEQRAARAERATQRWRMPLDEGRRSLERSSCETLPTSERDTFLGEGLEPIPSIETAPTNNRDDDMNTPRAILPSGDDLEAVRNNSVSPSIYSRTTDSPCSFNMNSVAKLPYAMHTEATGSAVIITSRPVSSWVIGTPTPSKRISHSARSSKDWKAWLSKEVAELEQLAGSDITIEDKWDFQSNNSSRHRRERTQISEDDARSVSSSNPKCLPRLVRSRIDSRSGSRMNERFPMLDTGRRSSSHSIKTIRSDRKASPAMSAPEAAAPAMLGKAKENVTGAARNSPLPRISRQVTASPRSATVARYTASSGVARSTTDLLATPSPSAPARKLGRRISKAKSALELNAQYSTSPEKLRTRIARKAVAGPHLEGDTLRMILEGPYPQTKTPSPIKRHENSRMVSKFSEIGLDETRSVKSKRSDTPGNRLADAFLRERKSIDIMKDETPVFI